MENQKLNKGAEQYPSMDDAAADMDSSTAMDADPNVEKPAGAAELMTPDTAPGPEDDPNNPMNAASNRDQNLPRDHTTSDQLRDVRMKSSQPGSVDTNHGEGAGTGDGTGASEAG
ncbi:hypothetical protein [Tellurirhabdus rosea]|uniref:hypothetical protein n=1 Tax=Tellurirhabdus rosea TaxID=2674997 RepID=UPI0022585248|nr:hypothetical protein [Tellurirhabdus rosea]